MPRTKNSCDYLQKYVLLTRLDEHAVSLYFPQLQTEKASSDYRTKTTRIKQKYVKLFHPGAIERGVQATAGKINMRAELANKQVHNAAVANIIFLSFTRGRRY